MEKRVYYTEKHMELLNDETLKRRGFEFESAKNFGSDKPGYYFVISGDEEFFDSCEILENAEEVKGDEKEEILKKFEAADDDVASGIGLLD
jgi:hypothetical protein